MEIVENIPVLEEILNAWKPALGADFTAYANHCYRVLNYCHALCKTDALADHDKIVIATAFHDMGIWSAQTFDYLAASKKLALEYLTESSQLAWRDEIVEMIDYHHKITPLGKDRQLAEYFRRADWIDVSRGLLKFGLPAKFIKSVAVRFPNAGFHRCLFILFTRRVCTRPFSPLPMLKL